MTVKEKGARSKNKILDVAADCLREQGVRNLNIDDICKNAGLTRGAFYHHFKDKNHLLEELLKKWISGKVDEYEVSQNARPFDMVELLSTFIGELTSQDSSGGESEDQIKLFLDLSRQALKEKRLRDYILKVHRDFMSHYIEIIKSKSQKGSAQGLNTKDLARLFLSLTKSDRGEAMNMIFSLFISSDANW